MCLFQKIMNRLVITHIYICMVIRHLFACIPRISNSISLNIRKLFQALNINREIEYTEHFYRFIYTRKYFTLSRNILF